MSDEMTRLSYREIAERYDLGSVKHGGDFQLTDDGDIKVLNGDIQIGDVTHNALHRFVVAWQFNAPMHKTMVDFVAESERKRQQFDEELEEVDARRTRRAVCAGEFRLRFLSHDHAARRDRTQCDHGRGRCRLARRRGLVAPGRARRVDALVANAWRAGTLAIGTACTLVVAGTIEGFITPQRVSPEVRIAVGALKAIALFAYVALAGRSPREPDAGDESPEDRPFALENGRSHESSALAFPPRCRAAMLSKLTTDFCAER